VKNAIKKRALAVLDVLGAIVWRGFGAFLFILGAAAATGSILTGSWLNGVLIAWGTLMLGVIGAIGYAIMTTGKATAADVSKAYRDAAEKVAEEQESKRSK